MLSFNDQRSRRRDRSIRRLSRSRSLSPLPARRSADEARQPSAAAAIRPATSTSRAGISTSAAPIRRSTRRSTQIDKSNVGRLEVAWTYPTGRELSRSIRSSSEHDVRAREEALDRRARRGDGPRDLGARERGRRRRARHELLAQRRRQRGAAAVRQRRASSPRSTRRPATRSRRSATTAASTCASASTATSRRFARCKPSNPGRIFEDLIIMSLPAGGGGYASSPADIHAYNVRTGALAVDLPHRAAARRVRRRDVARSRARQLRRRAQLERVHGRRRDRHRSTSRPAPRATTSTAATATARTCSATACSRSTRAAASGCGTSRRSTTICGTTTFPTAPKLLTVVHDGVSIPAIAQPSKQGFVYVFNRITGAPLWPIEERPVPQSDMPGEKSWPTQPFPTAPPPFARQSFTEADINPHISAEDQAKVREIPAQRRATKACTRRRACKARS